MTKPSHGDVVLYSYLWAREAERGEETGRKSRPACVMVIFKGSDGKEMALLFPITSRPPSPQTSALEIPETEAQRTRLYTPAWVVVDEFNTDDLDTSYALEDREPLGSFSRKFIRQIAAKAAGTIRSGKIREVSRS